MRGTYRANANLGQYTWFRVGGPAEVLYRPADEADLAAFMWGKPADVPWAIIFCNETIRAAHGGTCPAGEMPRHPSQIYEGLLEGIVIFLVLRLMIKMFSALNRPGLVIAAFMGFYGLFRILVEIFFRDSDQLVGGTALTMGTLLSLPMWLGAAFFFWYSQRKPA